MSHIVTIVLLGDSDLCTGGDWAGERGAEKIAAFVLGIALDGTEAEFLDKFALEVNDHHLLSADFEGLLLDLVPGLVLANIGQEADDFIAFLYGAF